MLKQPPDSHATHMAAVYAADLVFKCIQHRTVSKPACSDRKAHQREAAEILPTRLRATWPAAPLEGPELIIQESVVIALDTIVAEILEWRPASHPCPGSRTSVLASPSR